jgi:hypothetical protein
VSVWGSTGVWLAAVAVAFTYGAARVPDASPTNAAAPTTLPIGAPRHLLPSQPIDGDVDATIPEAAFGPADGAPQALVSGKTYPVVITVFVAVTSGPAVVDVVASSGRLLGAAHTTLRAGVTRLRYELVVAPGSRFLTIAAHVRTHDGGAVTDAYNHQVR